MPAVRGAPEEARTAPESLPLSGTRAERNCPVTEPLKVVVTWDDACARHTEGAWDGTLDTAAKIPALAPLYHGRQSMGWLTYWNEAAVWLASDYDAEEGLVSTFSVIPLGWVTKIKTHKGKIIYERYAVAQTSRVTTARARGPRQ